MTKPIKILLITAAASLLFPLIPGLPSGVVHAFHEGGVGYCEGCHDLHISQQRIGDGTDGSGISEFTSYMLKGSDPSSTCLICHARAGENHNIFSKDGSQFTPGGDFYWLKKNFTAVVGGSTYLSEGDNHGHNIIAADYGLTEDKVLNSAPGGAYSSFAMGCHSCHNPHGTISGNATNSQAIALSGSYGGIAPQGTVAGNYRLLGGSGYNGGSHSDGIIFIYPAPIAVANAGDWTETDYNHPAYGSGMSEWCGNCHIDMLGDSGKHPAGGNARLTGAIVTNYNTYLKTGDATGIQATSYLSLVPFELGTAERSLLDSSGTAGPDAFGNANVMCLTCHRVHASAFPFIGRWDFKTTFIADSHPAHGDGGVTGNDVLHSYYGRNMTAQFGPYQRSLCNKCHVQD